MSANLGLVLGLIDLYGKVEDPRAFAAETEMLVLDTLFEECRRAGFDVRRIVRVKENDVHIAIVHYRPKHCRRLVGLTGGRGSSPLAAAFDAFTTWNDSQARERNS